jgi:RNA-binding protein
MPERAAAGLHFGMQTLTSAERRTLRAQAHALHPVVSIGNHGLTPSVLHEIDVALLAHELIKIRVFSDVRAERNALFERLCNELSAAPVQHLGKVLIIWREAPETEQSERPTRSRRESGARSRETGVRTLANPKARTPSASIQTGKPGAPRTSASKSRSADAAARRRRPSDVISTGAAPGKRRAVSSGKASDGRKRAPATTKGPFEPGKRSPRSGSGAASAAGSGERRRRALGALEGAADTGAPRRRPVPDAARTGSGAKSATRRRRGS